jgi:hypothetical protein
METMGNGELGSCLRGATYTRNPGDEITENKVKFNYRTDREIVDDIKVDKENPEDAIKEGMYLIDNALARICFAYNREPAVSENSCYGSVKR